MSSEVSTARARLLPRANLNPGPLRDFKDAVYQLYLKDRVTLDGLERRIRAMAEASEINPACEPMATPKRDTIRAIISDTVLPQDLRAVTAVAAGLVFLRHHDLTSVSVLADPTVRQIRDLWSRAASQRPLGRPISDVRPVEDLSVHSVGVVNPDGLQMLPPYVERSHDATVRELVRRALAGHSGIGILVSDSTSGKTRAIAEALTWAPETRTGSLADNGWRVWPQHTPTPQYRRKIVGGHCVDRSAHSGVARRSPTISTSSAN